MSALRPLILAALLGLSLSAPATAVSALPESASVQRSLDRLAERKLPEAEQKAVQQSLEQTLSNLAALEQTRQQLLDLKQQLKSAPRSISEARQELQRLNASPLQPAAKRHAGRDLASLEKLLAERSQQLSDAQKALSSANSQLINAQTRPERAQAEISKNQQRSQQIAAALKSGKDNGKLLGSEGRDLLNSEQALIAARTQLLQQELAGNNLLQELASNQRELQMARIARLEQESFDLQTLVSEKRSALSQQTVEQLSQEPQQSTPDSLLARESDANLQLSNYLLQTTERLNQVNRLSLEATQQLDSLNQAGQALDEQISVLKGSLLLAKILYQQKQALPQIRQDSRLADDIADIRLYQFELNQQREQLADPHAYLQQLLAKQPSEQVTPELRDNLLQLLSNRSELLQRLGLELNALLSASITLQLQQKQLESTSQTLRATLDEQMFWIPSNKPLDLDWLQQAPGYLQQQLAAMPWLSALSELWAGLLERPLFFAPLLLLIAALLWWRTAIRQKLRSLHQDIGHYKRDNQLRTPMALLLNVLLALPISLFLALCGLALLADARGQNAILGSALLQMAQAWLAFYTLHRILMPGGVAEVHFHWQPSQVAFLNSQMRRLGMVVMALVSVVTIAEHQPAMLAEDVLGILVVLSCFGLMAWLLVRLLFAEQTQAHASPLRRLIGLGFIALPVGLMIAVGFGYYYTALKLTDRLIDTLYLLLLWIVLEATVMRGLAVAARRLAYQRMQTRRQSQPKEGPDGGEVLEEPTLDLEQINQQSLRLIRMAMFGVFIGALYWIWADLISVFTYLDTVTLYEYSSGTGESMTMVPISLLDVLGALIVFGITVVLATNLPGLLEVLVLSRLQLAQGSAYATTTLLSYGISGIGFVATLSALGVSWDKLQWLVAALSLGIGFGMQEIFANFISGLIILFERPVRIGDVVTIGNLSGTVSRIRIRATTITDFDRKEIIVPNKTFITGQLVNWSLTDTITRVTIKLGVSYGSDLELVRSLLLQAANDNPRVLKEPAPLVYFLNFGESTLDHELRIHVRDLADRNPAIDEINRCIDRSFREHGLEIAFRQLEVFVKNLAGQELHLTPAQTRAGRGKPETPESAGGDEE